jgi:hypothetical protein
MLEWNLTRDGFCMLHQAIDSEMIQRLVSVFDVAFEDESQSIRARSSRGHVYAARNLIESIPEVGTVWQTEVTLAVLREHLGGGFGLVRALFFDKPPDRTWNLPWHKDMSIAVKDNTIASSSFSRPTIKSGVPHVTCLMATGGTTLSGRNRSRPGMANGRYRTRICDLHDVNVAL